MDLGNTLASGPLNSAWHDQRKEKITLPEDYFT
jgi:hypothetical protein